jgi:Ser/Thr protein kinase RdoA (MazF antagonist)
VRLHETIPDFHHTPKRLQALEAAVKNNLAGRAADVQAEIDFARARAADCPRITDLIASGAIPERVTHNDTKLNNVLLDETTAEGICVIDLDTTMPGSALYDFGDMVRTAAPTTREDDPDVSHIGVNLDRFDALVRGYLSTATFLNEGELANLAFSGKLITLECGIRFLTDHLDGDTYFKIKRPGHNLDRCRNQFAFVRALEANMEAMEEIVASASLVPA